MNRTFTSEYCYDLLLRHTEKLGIEVDQKDLLSPSNPKQFVDQLERIIGTQQINLLQQSLQKESRFADLLTTVSRVKKQPTKIPLTDFFINAQISEQKYRFALPTKSPEDLIDRAIVIEDYYWIQFHVIDVRTIDDDAKGTPNNCNILFDGDCLLKVDWYAEEPLLLRYWKDVDLTELLHTIASTQLLGVKVIFRGGSGLLANKTMLISYTKEETTILDAKLSWNGISLPSTFCYNLYDVHNPDDHFILKVKFVPLEESKEKAQTQVHHNVLKVELHPAGSHSQDKEKIKLCKKFRYENLLSLVAQEETYKNVKFQDCSVVNYASTTENSTTALLKEIDKLSDDVVSALTQETGFSTLDQLAQYMMQNLDSVELLDQWIEAEDVQRSEVVEAIQRNVRLIHAKIRMIGETSMQLSLGALLRVLVLRASSLRWLDREETLDVLKSVELVEESMQYLKELQDKDLVLFLGNTGAGKSTTIAFCLDAPLKEIDLYGEKALEINREMKVSQNEVDAPSLPKIGQSLGTSETAYARGYNIPTSLLQDALDDFIVEKSDIALVDLPGFRDTRGVMYQVATMISVGLAIRQAKRIQAVAIVVPYQFIIMDRSMPLVQFLKQFQYMLPTVFARNERSSASSDSPIVIMVTKCPPDMHDVDSQFNSRLQQLLREDEETLRLQRKEKHNSEDIKDTENRIKLWTYLQSLHGKGNIVFVDNKDRTLIQHILTKFVRSPGIDSKDIRNIFQSAHLNVDLCNKVNLAADMNLQLLQTLLEQLPEAIKESDEKIAALEKKMVDSDAVLAELAEADAKAESELVHIAELESKLIPAVTTPNEGDQSLPLAPPSTTNVGAEIEAMRAELVQRRTVALREEIDAVNKKKQILRHKVTLLDEEIDDLRSHARNKQVEIDEIKAKVDLLTFGHDRSGKHIATLHEHMPGLELHLRTWKEGQMDVAFSDIRDTVDSDFVEGSQRVVDARTFKGSTLQHAYISKEFNILSSDPEERRLFLSAVDNHGANINNRFVAKLEGRKYKMLRANACDDRRICYQYKLNFDGTEELPYLIIRHEILLAIKNGTDISNLRHQQLRIKEKKDHIEIDIQQLTTEKIDLMKDLQNLEKHLADLEQSLAQKELEIMWDVVDEYRKRLEDDKVRREEERSSELKRKQFIELELVKEKENGVNLVRKRVHYAVLVYHQMEMFVSVDRLCSILLQDVLPKEDSNIQASLPSGLAEKCKEYRQMFHEKQDEVRAECAALIASYADGIAAQRP